MSYRNLIGKIAADKNSQKLGIIVRIEDLLGKTIKKKKPHALIRYERRFKKDVIVPIDLEKIVKSEKSYTWFDITKKEFEKEAKEAKGILETQTEREIYSGGASRTFSTRTVIDHMALSRVKKERKRKK